MTTLEKTAEKLKAAQRTMRELYGDYWPQVSAPYREFLKTTMDRSGEMNVLRVAIPAARELERYRHNPILVLATAADMADEAKGDGQAAG